MQKFLSIILLMFTILNFSICYADTKMKLYRNKEYQFSIEIPEFLPYKTPRGPNVKMVAAIEEFNMNIIVKPYPYLRFADDEMLAELFTENVQEYPYKDMKIIESDIINIPHLRVLYEGILAKYTYPKYTFFLYCYIFQFVTNYKYYCISYFVEPGKENLYTDVIIKSIGSFVDETGWY